MNPSEAVQFAQELLSEYGLHGWRVDLDGAVRRFGCCHYSRKLITLSYQLVRMNSETDVLDTILHEIAHSRSQKIVAEISGSWLGILA